MSKTLEEVQEIVSKEVGIDLCSKTSTELQAIAYAGLAEEAGEVNGLWKRQLRNFGRKDQARCTREHFVEELGDVLWYLTMCCMMCQTTLDEVWSYNRGKLEARYGKRD